MISQLFFFQFTFPVHSYIILSVRTSSVTQLHSFFKGKKKKMCAESSWLILVSICKLFNPTVDEHHFCKSSLIRAESQQKQQAEASYYQALKWGQQIYDTWGESIIEMCNAQQALLGVSWNFPCCIISLHA